MRELEEKIGYTFKNKEILIEALTHSSYSNEMKSKGEKIAFNERLEFLGDSVLSIVVSSYIFEKYRSKQEGDLTKIRAAVVCEKALSKFAGEIELGDYMFLGHGEIMNNGRRRPSITADAFEALLAAIYLDTGETFSVVEKFLLPFIAKEIDYISASGVFIDYKTALQQIVQQASGEILEYVLVGESGPDHNKQFMVEARLNSNIIGRGCAKTKRAAEQQAAHEALILFGEG
ncbi:MAG: ribonuclease III [Clostridia bacterium]|nr:ribonuclease III [Clostridia bacterium]